MEDKIREFLSVATDSNRDQAAHYIELAKGDVYQALNQFYEGLGGEASIRPPSPPKPSQPSSTAPPKTSSQKSSSSKSSSSGSSSSRIASLADFQNDDSHDSDEDDGQEFFAGGKASGVALQGPPNAKKSAQDAIGKILQTAHETGKKEQEKQSETQNKRSKVFHGAGHRLGEGEGEGEAESNIPTPQDSQISSQNDSDQEQELEELQYILTFWEDGFSIDDGPLRDYKDPRNEEFLKTLGMGQVPSELKARPNQRVKVMVQHRVQDKYVPPKKVLKPFQGTGNRLGSEIPGETTGFTTSSPPPPTLPVSTSSATTSSPASSAPAFGANSNEPLTTVQIRLADGTRLVAKFNPTQTVEDIHRFINMSRPGESQRNYVLMTTFPNKEITDVTQTLQQAQLLNAVVVQRYK